MIRCDCLSPHPDHQFQAGGPQALLCRTCGHNLAAHVPVPFTDQVVNLLRVFDVTSWSLDPQGDGEFVLSIYLTPFGKLPP